MSEIDPTRTVSPMTAESPVDPMRTLVLEGTVTVTVTRRLRTFAGFGALGLLLAGTSSVVIAATIAALVPTVLAVGTFVSVLLPHPVNLTP